MVGFSLKKHNVVKASFAENAEVEKRSLELGIDGNILVPKNLGETNQVMVKLRLHLGKDDERLVLALETVSTFEIVDWVEGELTEEIVQQRCLPLALAKLRNTVKMVSEAYGLPSIDLPPFDGENTEE